MDLVIGKEQESAVLTIIERSTNMFFQSKIESKQPHIVTQTAYRYYCLIKKKSILLQLITDWNSKNIRG